MKDKKDITIINAIQKILDKPNCKPNKIWVDKGSEFMVTRQGYRNVWTHNEGKYVVAERFIRILKNKICKHLTSIPKRIYATKLMMQLMSAMIHIIEPLKWSLLMSSPAHISNLVQKIIEILNLKLVIMSEYQKMKKWGFC